MHTPGPWEILWLGPVGDRTDGIESNAVPGAEHRLICEMWHDADMGQPYTEVIDNARLIAAAPDLLEACQTVKTFLDDLQRNTAPGDPLAAIRRRVHGPLLERLESAIAKAEYQAKLPKVDA